MPETAMRRFFPLLLLGFANLGLAASTYAAELPPVFESRPVTGAQSGGSTQVGSLEQRVSKLERMMENQALVDMMMRLEDLQREVQELRGQIEVQVHDVDGIKQRQRELYLDIDRRLGQLERSGSSAPPSGSAAPPAAPVSAGPGAGDARLSAPSPSMPVASASMTSAVSPVPGTMGAPGGAQAADPLQEQTAYNRALDILRDGKYEEAIKEFRAFLTAYPSGQYADNAQYWLGEASYVTRQFPLAVEEFNKVVVSFPDSPKVPDAMLKVGYTYYELQQWDDVRRVLNDLVARYPKSTAAQLAQNRLHRMKLEGR